MNIYIKTKNVYGKSLIYPDCETAKLFCKLTRKKTFLEEDLRIIRSLGYHIIKPVYEENIFPQY